MTTATSRGRLVLTAVTLLCALALFRGSLANAVVSRGDDVLAGGDLDGAARFYARALALDGGAAVASDRLAFSLLLRRKPGDAALAFTIASRALRFAPHDPALLVDRGFAAQRLGRWRDAERAFAAAAGVAADPRYAHLAAHMARRGGDPAAERFHLRTALQIDPAYGPARMLLARIGR